MLMVPVVVVMVLMMVVLTVLMMVASTMLVVVLAAMLAMLIMVPVLLTMLWRCRSQYRRRHRPATASKITRAEVPATKDDA